MTFRVILYWPHLVCGVLLTYKNQIIRLAESDYNLENIPEVDRLSIEVLKAKAMAEMDGKVPCSIQIRCSEFEPVVVNFGRDGSLYINPYSVEIFGAWSIRGPVFF
jgi:hypothetical protein